MPPMRPREIFSAEFKLYEVLAESPFQAICIKAAELEAYSRHPKLDRDEDKLQKDVHRCVKEEIRRQNQARLAIQCARLTAQRLFGDNKTETTKAKTYGEERLWWRFSPELMGDEDTEKKGVLKLTGVTIFPKVDGQLGGDYADVGTLEAHSDNEKKKMLPLVHFQLHHPITLGTEKTKHLQFRLVPTVVGKKRSDDDSDKCEKEKQTMDSGRSDDLENFVDKVKGKWRVSNSPFPFPFTWINNDEEFHGASDIFVLTASSLVQLANTPFWVVHQRDIEIVNLARLRPQVIDMTIVLKDFSCPVLQIRAIPLDSLDGIKRSLDFWGVKFYENTRDLDWNLEVKRIAEFPESFLQKGGWDAYKLEDSATSVYYKHYYLEASQSDDDLYDEI
ncbi:hypothetical protein MKW92_028813 [Papaver armeniacum]|nr:hypothetical protein MKW92_028813 [Papaver armeniacum]